MRILGPDGQPAVRRERLSERMSMSAEILGIWPGADTAYDGASRRITDLSGFNPPNISPQSALSLDRGRLAARIHHMGRNDGWASSAFSRQVDSVIGAGWRLTAKPNAISLGIEPSAANDLAIQIEAAWRDYSTDPDCCDAGQRFTVGGLLAIGFRHRVADGEGLAVNLWLDRGGDYCTCLQVIHPDRLSNPNMMPDYYWRRGGVEIGSYGEPLAYNIRDCHPGDYASYNPKLWRWERLARNLPNGRRQVIHAFEPTEAEMVRGAPPLAPVVQKLHMLGRYDKAELQAAVINAVLAAVVTSNDQTQVAEALGGDATRDGAGVSAVQEDRIGFYGDRPVKIEGAQINYLYPTDKLDLTRPQHPNSGFEAFYRTGLRNIAAAAGLSYEQLSMDWSQTNYSSARGALLEVWKGFSARKESFAQQFMAPFYAAWLEEAIDNGRVKLPAGAPAFREARQAYCQVRWIGPPRGWVDPLKEAEAAALRLSAGLSTFEKECADQGEWYMDVFHQRARELDQMRALGLDPYELTRGALPKSKTQAPIDPTPAVTPQTDDPEKDASDAEAT